MMEHDLTGMSTAAAKEYILGLMTSLKLTEKEIHSLENEEAKWRNRVDLARSQGMDDLEREAERKADEISIKLKELQEEKHTLRSSIADLRRRLPALAAQERSIDPELLEQELLMAMGLTEEEAETERAFQKLEKEVEAEAALEALKAKMRGDKV